MKYITDMNPFIETLNTKEELFADFKQFAERKVELGQNALLAHYGLFHGEAIEKFCGGRVESLMNYAGIPITSSAYFQAGIRAWNNLNKGLTNLPEQKKGITNSKTNELEPLQRIFYGAPGTGKSFAVNEVTKHYPSTIRTTFHPDSDYSTFVGAYKPTSYRDNRYVMDGSNPIAMKYPNDDDIISRQGKNIKESRIEYRFVKQAFLKAYIKAWQLFSKAEDMENVEPQFLVIEEINRGNCAQIFGDLFQLLDRKNGFSEYPIDADEDIHKSLICENIELDPSFGETGLQLNEKQRAAINDLYNDENATFRDFAEDICKGRILALPCNLYIWATMNTSDQSLFPIDSAFKRRWDWQYVPIVDVEKNWKIDINGKQYNWWNFLEKINFEIGDTTNSEDKKLGYFFCKTQNGIIDADTFINKVIFYIWNDVFKDYGFGKEIFNDSNDTDGNPKLTFDKFYKADGKDKVIQFLNNLGVLLIGNEEVPEEETNDSRFSLNGVRMSLRNIAMNVVLDYANNNPAKPAQDIRDYFVNLCKGIGVAHIVETEDEYHLRDSQPSQERTVSEITLPNGLDKLYVSTQWRANNENSNFIRFMSIVNNNGLGVISQ